MKKIIYFSVITATALSLLSSCVDTHDTLPYVDPNVQSSQAASSDKSAYGTADSPIEISSIKDLGTNNDTAYVSGYIVGYVCGTKLSSGAVFVPSDTVSQTANILIAESADVTESSKCVPVQLPTGKIRTALNLKDNKDNFGKQVVIGGCMAKYFGVKGLKNTFYAKIDGKEISSILAPTDNTSPQPVVTEIDEPFSETMGNFRFRDVISADSAFDVWSFTNYGMVATAFKNKKNFATESWLISPPVDLTGKTTAYFTFDHAAAYFADNNLIDKACQVLASNDSTDWEALEITWPKESNGKSYTFVNSGIIDLSKYAGKSRVRVAFKYTSTAEKAGTWELKNVKLQETEPVIVKQEHAAKPDGEGTKEKPYNVSAVQENETPTDYVWVKGVIVGFIPSSGKVTFSATGAVATNIAIADADTVKTAFNSTSVKLSTDEMKNLLSLAKVPTNLGKEVLMYVKIGSYYGFTRGITEVKYAKIGDKEAGIDPTAAPKEPIKDQIEGTDNLSEKITTLPYEDLTASQGKFTSYCVSKNGNLTTSSIWNYNATNTCMKGSAYINGSNFDSEVWLISPEIELGSSANSVLKFSQSGQYFEVDVKSSCSVLISTNYTSGNPTSATWKDLEISEWPTAVKTFVDNSVDLTDYKGQKIRVAFKYTSTEEKAGTWQIKDFKVSEVSAAPVSGYDGTNNTQTVITSYPYSNTLKNSLGNFSVYDVKRFDASDSHVWSATSNGAVSSSTAEAESWLISPKFDLTNVQEPLLSFTTWYKDITTPSTYYTAYILENYDGSDISQATKTALTISFKATSGTQANNIDLKDYKGKKITIAFKYQSPEDFAGQYEIVNFSVKDNANTKGTYEDPYTCEEWKNLAAGTKGYVKCYIVGYVKSATNVVFNSTDAVNSNLAVSDNKNATEVSECVFVKLPTGAIRTLLNIKDNTGNIGKEVLLYGTNGNYFSTDGGISTLSYTELNGSTAGTKPTN
ncbi:MAG: choice-of-anchor J domain-containing protein [Bacteroidales bacterium]|nr:choice-of-anchor J domain-containing protein [Bacteroidales bacterium]